MKSAVVVFPGSNSDYEAYHVLKHVLGQPTDLVWHKESSLDGYDAATKRMLLSESKEAALRGYNAKLSRLDSTKLQQALSEQATISEQVEQILNNPQSRGIEEFRKLVRDRGGPFKTSVRAAVLEGIMRKIRATSSGGAEVLDGKKLKGIISEYRESGVWNLLEFHDQAFLNDVQKVRSVLSVSGDAGTSIRAAQVASGLVEFADTAFFEFLESFTTGRILTSEGGKRFLIGSAHNKVTDVGHIRLMGSIITTISQDVERED